jgi:hypothetical protein
MASPPRDLRERVLATAEAGRSYRAAGCTGRPGVPGGRVCRAAGCAGRPGVPGGRACRAAGRAGRPGVPGGRACQGRWRKRSASAYRAWGEGATAAVRYRQPGGQADGRQSPVPLAGREHASWAAGRHAASLESSASGSIPAIPSRCTSNTGTGPCSASPGNVTVTAASTRDGQPGGQAAGRHASAAGRA